MGKTELFQYIKTGVAPKYDPDETTDSRTALSDLGLERLEHETQAYGRDIKVLNTFIVFIGTLLAYIIASWTAKAKR